MSEDLHTGIHPDADSLSAFMEGRLPEHERLTCLAHLAECPRCRKIVYLAAPPLAPVSAPVSPDLVPFWKRWFVPVPVLAAAAVMCVVVFSIWAYRTANPVARVPATVANGGRAVAMSTPREGPARQMPAPLPTSSKTDRSRPSRVKSKPPSTSAPAAETSQTNALAEAPLPLRPVPSPPPLPVNPAAAPAPATSPVIPPALGKAPGAGVAAISGTITDPTGAVIPGASVTVHPVGGDSASTARTDAQGHFNVAGLPPGPYELQIDSPGFKRTSKPIELQPQETARVDSTLAVGEAAESVTVAAAVATLNAESGGVAPAQLEDRALKSKPIVLPSKRTPIANAAIGKWTNAVDANGTLFFSKNSGKSWKAVKPAWQGKVVRLGTRPETPQSSSLLFQLTTDSGSEWLSRDGRHWYPAPAPR